MWNSFSGSEESPLVDINSASVDDFVNLLSISHTEAEAIVNVRRLQGGFHSVADLLKVPGVTSDFNKKILTCSSTVSCCRHVVYTHRCYCRCREIRCCKEEQVDRCEASCCKKATPRSDLCCEAARAAEFKCETCSSSKEPEHQCSGERSERRSARWCCSCRESKCYECDSEPFLCAPGPSKLSSSGCGGSSCGHANSAIVPNPCVKDAEINSIASSVRKLLRGSAASGDKGDIDFGGECSDALSESEMESSSEEEECCFGANGLTSLSKFASDKLLMKRKSDGLSDPRVDNPEKKPCRTKKIVCSSVQTPPADISMDSGIVEADSEELTPTENKIEKCHVPVLIEKRLATRVNPPPELGSWLTMFQTWSNAERLLALDRLIEMSEASQIRHMMCVIEPQFQRDFISLLPKELALYVLSFLEPRDLLRAAQTCRNWRILAEDNLLWREKCRETGIEDVREVLGKRRARSNSANTAVSESDQTLHPSPWKSAYMREHNIEMNWRCRPIRTPKVLKGHDDHVITCLQFSGNRIVSGSDDNTLKVWSALTGKCLKTLVGHTGGVWSSQMAGNIVISGSTDRTLKVWNADSGHCIHTLYGHTSTVRCMHLCGNRVVSGSRDATLRLWDVETGVCLHVLVGHVAAVRCVQYNGKLVVSGAYDYMVKVWNPEREECLHTLQGHTNRVYSLQFDGVHVVSGSLDTSIRVWDVETGACKHTLMGHQSLTSGMELRNNILVSGNADSTVKVWDILTGQCLQTLAGPQKHQSAVTCLQFNSKFVVTSSDDGTVKLWDLKTGEFIRNLVALDSGGSGGVVWRIRASAVKLVCAVGSRNGTEETKLLVLDFEGESPK